ncbi:MAG: valine--tRNA ligase [Patescibacteria group bacterium]|jgi:valyl-tRNA synthetase
MLSKQYNHRETETSTYELWEKKGYFTPKIVPEKKPFTIVMPPPNANGALHIGHVLFITVEDIMARFARMQGLPTLLLPGADHAGILTQVVFEKKLKNKKISRYDLGREEFFRQCMEFSLNNKELMYAQIKRVGASADWSREKFTLDPDVSKQVVETFVKLFEDNLIYRDYRMINWCPRCSTALSDLEVEHHEEKSGLYFITYPLAGNPEQSLTVATTRPETMLGDTAVAVHPEDKRYKKFIGSMLELPLTSRTIPVIADTVVDPEFGTGAVKVTPAHDPVDFEIGKRHSLPIIRVINFRNRMTEEAGKEFADLKAQDARVKVLEKLKEKELLLKTKEYIHQVGHCERCNSVLEPQVSQQWFIKIEPLAKPALDVVEKNAIKIVPTRFKKIYRNWMVNLRDWCISRQLWWGHRIPVYYCGLSGLSELQKQMNPGLVEKYHKVKGCGKLVVASEKPQKCPYCGNTELIQDPDTLDTWFSSGQWPYTTLGYPESEDFKYFYPTSIMETGYDILWIWVSRMIMFGLYRTGTVPFKTVYLHGLVRDEQGQKMSKSKGNVIDPLLIIEKYGADALRMGLVVGATPGNDISVGESKIKGYRNFSNKLWNIARFISLSTEGKKPETFSPYLSGLNSDDKKFIEKLNELTLVVTTNLRSYKYSFAGESLYSFIWHELADRYIEDSKDRIKNGDTAVLSVLTHTLKTCLKLLHPFMPFVTEAIWQQFKEKTEPDLIVSSWPSPVN